MKPKLLTTSLALILFSINISIALAQDWSWDWAEDSFVIGYDSWTDAIHADLLNNVYCRSSYGPNIHFPDTSFLHPEQYDQNANYAISKYDFRGNFIKALDLYTVPNGNIHYVSLVTDSLLNIYLCAPFNYKVNLCDTFISPGENLNPFCLDVFLAKLSPDFEFLWGSLITTNSQDESKEMLISDDGFLYIMCNHLGGGTAVYLNQDSASYPTNFSSIIKADLNGNLIWHKEIRSYGSSREFQIGENGLIYFLGYLYSDVVIDNDTLQHPYPLEMNSLRYQVIFNPDGEFLESYFFDWDIWLWETNVNANGDLYISGMISDTAVIGSDTIIVPEGLNYGIIGKFTSQLEPVWYQLSTESLFWLYLDDDHVIFYTNADGICEIADTTINVGNYSELVSGEFDSEGKLTNIMTTNGTQDIQSVFGFLDNCRNLIVGGSFIGRAVFGLDTITSQYYTWQDGFVAKLQRHELTTFDLGPDTLACAEHTLYGPAGYLYYSWNNTITNQNSYTAIETGTITFACANEDGCWLYDTINVQIHPGFAIDLGPDTSIFQNESIIFTVPEGYDSYLWSNTVTANSISVFGDSYPPGTIKKIWVQVTDGPCIISDTVYVTIKSEFAVEDISDNGIFLYPNPFDDFVYIKASTAIDQIEICDLNGSALFVMEIYSSPGEMIKISLKNLNQGVYMLKLNYRESQSVKKIIKL